MRCKPEELKKHRAFQPGIPDKLIQKYRAEFLRWNRHKQPLRLLFIILQKGRPLLGQEL
jgi:hypothetical protein